MCLYGCYVPLLIIFPLLALDKLGYSPYATSNWCFISSNNREIDYVIAKPEIALIFLGGKLWEILAYFFVIITYAVTIDDEAT